MLCSKFGVIMCHMHWTCDSTFITVVPTVLPVIIGGSKGGPIWLCPIMVLGRGLAWPLPKTMMGAMGKFVSAHPQAEQKSIFRTFLSGREDLGVGMVHLVVLACPFWAMSKKSCQLF